MGNKTEWTYDANSNVASILQTDWNEETNAAAAWDYGVYIDEILAMHRDTNDDGTLDTTYYYLQDNLYNVVGLVDASGTVVERYAYNDCGAPTIYSGDGATTRSESAYDNPFLFQGRLGSDVIVRLQGGLPGLSRCK